MAGAVSEPASWAGPAAELTAHGLEEVAAQLYPHRFPAGTPAELAWSARTLAFLGNGPAALGMGERLWARLEVPAWLVPDALRPLVLPPELVGGCVAAATVRGLRASWLVGVVRQESRFDAAARSAAGAVGLVQLVPETMRRLDRPDSGRQARCWRRRADWTSRWRPAGAWPRLTTPETNRRAWLGVLGNGFRCCSQWPCPIRPRPTCSRWWKGSGLTSGSERPHPATRGCASTLDLSFELTLGSLELRTHRRQVGRCAARRQDGTNSSLKAARLLGCGVDEGAKATRDVRSTTAARRVSSRSRTPRARRRPTDRTAREPPARSTTGARARHRSAGA